MLIHSSIYNKCNSASVTENESFLSAFKIYPVSEFRDKNISLLLLGAKEPAVKCMSSKNQEATKQNNEADNNLHSLMTDQLLARQSSCKHNMHSEYSAAMSEQKLISCLSNLS